MPIRRDLDHSRRRARLRDRVLVVLARKKRATLAQLSLDTGIRASRVQAILEGDKPEYATNLSLVHQGAARLEAVGGVREYAITRMGARAARRTIFESNAEKGD